MHVRDSLLRELCTLLPETELEEICFDASEFFRTTTDDAASPRLHFRLTYKTMATVLPETVKQRIMATALVRQVQSQFGSVTGEYTFKLWDTCYLWRLEDGSSIEFTGKAKSALHVSLGLSREMFEDLRIDETVRSGGWLLPGVSYESPGTVVLKESEESEHWFIIPKEEPHRLARFSANFSNQTGEKLIAAEELYLEDSPNKKLAVLVYGDGKLEGSHTVRFLIQIFADGAPVVQAAAGRDILQNISHALSQWVHILGLKSPYKQLDQSVAFPVDECFFETVVKLPVKSILFVVYLSQSVDDLGTVETAEIPGLTKILIHQLQDRHDWIFPSSLKAKYHLQENLLPEFEECCKRIIARCDDMVQARCTQVLTELYGSEDDPVRLLQRRIREIAESS